MNTRRKNNECTKLVGVTLVGLLLSIMTIDAKASTAPASFTYQGKIFNASGTQPLQAGSVTFKLQLRSPDGQCLLYEETHIRNMSGTGGVFSLNVGEGTNTGRTNLSLMQVIDNSANKTGDASCSYHPVAGDTRRIRLIYDDGSGDVTFPTDQTLRSVPYAMNSSTLQGMSKDKFVQTSTQITQNKVEQLFTSFQALIDLIQGNSTAYVKSSDLPVSNGVLNLSSGGVKVPNTPASNDSAVNRNYVDARVAGSTVDLTGLGNGQTMIWNATTNKWTVGYATLPSTGTAGTYSKVTTDAQGRVISGSALTAADIPAPAGDVGGTFGASTVQRIQGVNVSATAPVNGQVLTYNSTNSRWEATTPAAGTVTSVSASAPLAIATASTTPTISLQPGAGAGQSLIWSGTNWAITYPNVSQLRGVANNAQFPTTCTAGQTLVYYSPMDRYDCTDISIPSSRVTGLGGAATLSVGTAAGTVAAGNDSRIVNAVQASTTAGGDVSGSFSALSVNKIRGVDVTATAPTNGQVLKYDSSSSGFVFSADNNSGGTVTSVTPGTGFTTNTPITNTGTLNINVGTGANQIVQLDANGKLPALDASALTNLPAAPAAPFSNVVVLTSGTTWSNTTNAKRVFVQVWGGGGGGGGGTGLQAGGGGGAGGGYAAGFVDVTGQSSMNVQVGGAGTAGAVGGNGGNGGDSWFGSASTVAASGGAGGAAMATGTSAGGGTLVGAITVAGGRGASGTAAVNVVGVLSLVGLGGTGGSSGGGGGLGAGGSLGSASGGGSGTAPGGAGGGGGSGLLTGGAGGAGAQGRIVIWY